MMDKDRKTLTFQVALHLKGRKKLMSFFSIPERRTVEVLKNRAITFFSRFKRPRLNYINVLIHISSII